MRLWVSGGGSTPPTHTPSLSLALSLHLGMHVLSVARGIFLRKAPGMTCMPSRDDRHAPTKRQPKASRVLKGMPVISVALSAASRAARASSPERESYVSTYYASTERESYVSTYIESELCFDISSPERESYVSTYIRPGCYAHDSSNHPNHAVAYDPFHQKLTCLTQ